MCKRFALPTRFLLRNLPSDVNWRYMLGFGALPAVIILLSLLVIPESPRWLMAQGHVDKAEAVLRSTCHSQELDVTMAQLQETIECEAGLQGSWMDVLRPTPALRSMLVVGVGVAFFQQASGVDSAIYFVPTILEDAGIHDETKLLAANLVVGFCKVAFVVVAALLLDRIGRRPLMLLSSVGVTVSLAALGLVFVVGSRPGVAIAALCGFMASFSLGLGPVTWLLVAEVFPLRIRGRAMSLATAVNRVACGVVSISFLDLSKAISMGGAFMLFASIALLGTVFFWVWLPETRCRSMEEVEAWFYGRRQFQSDAEYASPSPSPTQQCVELSMREDDDDVRLLRRDVLQSGLGQDG